MITNELPIDHEVRIRLLEKIAESISNRFDKIEEKMDNQFHWTLGTIITMIIAVVTLFGGIILHLAKLI